MKLKELRHVELRCLQNLRLVDVDVLKGVDTPCSLLDLTADRLRNELQHQLLQVTAGRFPGHDLEHLFPDLPDLRRLRVRRLANLRWPTLGEADREEAEEVAVGRLHVNVRLHEGLPLADEGAELVRGEGHAVEVGETVLALDLVDPELDLEEGLLLVLVEVSKGNLDDTALQRVIGIPGTPNEPEFCSKMSMATYENPETCSQVSCRRF